jgi:hypothetical protein
VAEEDPALPRERQVVDVLRDEDLREQARPGPALLDRTRREVRLGDPLLAGLAR